MRRVTNLILILVLIMSANVRASSYFRRADSLDEFNALYIHDHLSVGLRVSSFSFSDPKQISYDSNGNIDGGYTRGISTYNLEERQSHFPSLYLLYKLSPYVALQLGWERVEGRAWTMDYADPHYDGDMTLSGPSFVVRGQYENTTAFTPYGAFGFALLSGKFDAESSWSNHGFRRMQVYDTTGIIYTFGTSAEISENVDLDLSISYMFAEPDAKYWLRPEGSDHPRARWQFPASSYVAQLGIRYLF